MRRLTSALYTLALRLMLPRDVFARDAAQMAAVFDDLLADARRSSGRLATLRHLIAEFRDLVSETRLKPRATTRPKGSPSMLSTFFQDVRYALRLLRRAPGFTVVATLTLALGIGGTTAIFSIVYAVLLRPLPFEAPDRLVVVGAADRDDGSIDSTSPFVFYEWRDRAHAFESLAGFVTGPATLTGRGEPERVSGLTSAGSVLEVLGVPAQHGRILTAADDASGRDPVIVLSHPLATRLFGAPDAAIGRQITLNDRDYAIVGVMPPDFRFPDGDARFWRPALFDPEMRHSRTQYFLLGLGRLKPDRTARQATDELNGIMSAIRASIASTDPDVRMTPLRESYVSDVRTRLVVLLGAVGAVLLVACANLANLLLARATGRAREIAVRQAIGSSRLRIVRQLLTESVVLSLLGGAAGVGLGWGLLQALIANLPPEITVLEAIQIDRVVLAAAMAATLLVGLSFGAAPALQLAREGPGSLLREGRGVSGRGRVRAVLVVAEMAVAVILLVGAGLLVRSFALLQRVDPGVRADGVLTFRLQLPNRYTPPQRVRFFEDVVARLERLPGVTAAAIVNTLPVDGRGIGAWFNIVGRPTPPGRQPDAVPYRVVSPSYFRVAGIPLLKGRLPTEQDSLAAVQAVVIDRTLARRYWPDEDPIGREVILGVLPDNVLFPRGTIVGIVGDVRQLGLDSEPPGMISIPHRVMPSWNSFAVMLRTTLPPETIVRSAREHVQAMDSSLPVYGVRTMHEVLAASVASTRLSMFLLAAFGTLALVMAAVGVYGVLSCTVTERQREMGIRLALGAEPAALRALMLKHGMRQAAIGLGIGVAGALALTRLMDTLLFGVTPTDPLTFSAVVALLGTVAALACYLPARRATRVDPVAIMRAE
ncbi:MAG: ABC transporter permease [Vicinamibacterales bacterium]